MKKILITQVQQLNAAVLQIGIDIYNIKKNIKKMGAELENIKAQNAALTAAIAEITTVAGGAVVLIEGFGAILADIKQQLADAIAANDPLALQAVADGIGANITTLNATKQKLADAVAANTVE